TPSPATWSQRYRLQSRRSRKRPLQPLVGQPDPPIPEVPMARAARTPNILVVDDDRATRHLTRATLAKAGYVVRVAKDGAEALTCLRGKKFDLVLLDVWMPKMDGLGVLDRMKKARMRPKVVVMTSDDAPETLLKAIRNQAHHYLHKPVEPSALVSLVRDTLKSGDEPPIDVVSARPNWVELDVPCTRDVADRLH